MPRKKAKRKNDEKFVKFKAEASHEFDEILLDSVDKLDDYHSFRKYSKDMESFKFKDVFGKDEKDR